MRSRYGNIISLSMIFWLLQVELAVAGWDIYDDHEQLKNHIIMDVGELEKHPRISNLDHYTEWFSLNSRCLEIDDGFTFSIGKWSALLLIDADKQIKVATIESRIGWFDVEIKNAKVVRCPRTY